MLTLTGLVEAGHIKESDEKPLFIQGISSEVAGAIAEWLAVTTNTKVTLRHIDALRGQDALICREPSDVRRASAQGALPMPQVQKITDRGPA